MAIRRLALMLMLRCIAPLPSVFAVDAWSSPFQQEQIDLQLEKLDRLLPDTSSKMITSDSFNGNSLRAIRTAAVEQLHSMWERTSAKLSTPVGFQIMRGLLWLAATQGILLMASAPSSAVLGDWQAIRIENFGLAKDSPRACRASRLAIWVRVSGPEVFAGLAEPDPTSACGWIFRFRPSVPGDYRMEAKVSSWNSNAPLHQQRAKIQKLDLPELLRSNMRSRARACA